MTPSGVEQYFVRSSPSSAYAVNQTMTPSGVEQSGSPTEWAAVAIVNQTMTPSGVEQIESFLILLVGVG